MYKLLIYSQRISELGPFYLAIPGSTDIICITLYRFVAFSYLFSSNFCLALSLVYLIMHISLAWDLAPQWGYAAKRGNMVRAGDGAVEPGEMPLTPLIHPEV